MNSCQILKKIFSNILEIKESFKSVAFQVFKRAFRSKTFMLGFLGLTSTNLSFLRPSVPEM